jgi:hypothetical protein
MRDEGRRMKNRFFVLHPSSLPWRLVRIHQSWWSPGSPQVYHQEVWSMRIRVASGAALALVLLFSNTFAADPLKSGPQVGDSLAAFSPENVTGPYAGSSRCLV